MQGQTQSSKSSTVHTNSPSPLRQAIETATHLQLIVKELETVAPRVVELETVQAALHLLYEMKPRIFTARSKPIAWNGCADETVNMDRNRMVLCLARIRRSRDLNPIIYAAFRDIFKLERNARMDLEKLLFSQSPDVPDTEALHFLRTVGRMMALVLPSS
jgi:hypothetical protein